MNKLKITKLLSAIVSLGGAIVMLGWILDIDVLKSILPFWVTMKFSTAISFFLSGVILYFVTCSLQKNSDLAQIMLAVASLMISLFMLTFLVSSLLNMRTGIEDIFITEAGEAMKSSTPGRPSIGTMINFILISVAGILTLNEINKLHEKIYIIGLVVFILGSTATLGYILSFPVLYFWINGFSSAMAIHTSILFILIGAGFILVGKNKKEVN